MSSQELITVAEKERNIGVATQDDVSTGVSSANTYTDGEITTLDTSLKAYADQAEIDAVTTANAYTDSEIAGAAVSSATETSEGLVELATQAEIDAGTDVSRVPTAATLQGKINGNVIGVNQTWQDVTASRAATTNYTNNTGKPIMVNVYTSSGSNVMDLIVDTVVVASNNLDTSAGSTASAIVPDGSVYSYTGSFDRWTELR